MLYFKKGYYSAMGWTFQKGFFAFTEVLVLFVFLIYFGELVMWMSFLFLIHFGKIFQKEGVLLMVVKRRK